MKNNLHREIKGYLNEIRRKLPKDAPNGKILLRMMRQDIDHFLAEQPDASLAAVIDEFGTADSVAASYMETLSETELSNRLRKSRRMSWILSAICLLAAFLLIYAFYFWKTAEYIVTRETLYIYDEEYAAEVQKDILEDLLNER